jgi:phosphinothricin acetyltransferase
MAGEGPIVRPATAADARACAEIYAPYVTDTAITFELEPPSEQEMRARIERAGERHAWVVIEDGHRIVGYAYGGVLNPRPAYRWSCEVSVYVELGRRRSGAGRALYEQLFERLRGRGLVMAACTGRWASSRSASTGGSASSTIAGTTWRGASDSSRPAPTRPPSPPERSRHALREPT